MGLFGLGKKNTLKSTDDFYSQCVKEFHKIAKQQGLVKRGQISVPELLPYGEKTVSEFLNDSSLQTQYGDSPAQYYFIIMSLSLQAGIVYADKWHEDPDVLNNGYVDQVIAEGASDAANELLAKYYEFNTEKANLFYSIIFEKWVEVLNPYWTLEEPWEYTSKALVAAYQLGVSMIFEKHNS